MKLGDMYSYPDSGERDAMHVCVICAYCSHNLNPGDWVRFTDSSYDEVASCTPGDADGMVDPFLETSVRAEVDYFLVILKPSLVSGFKHHFELDGYKSSKECANCS